jgi:ubiquinol-cytochrome c reductase cytochrome b subunit
MSTAVDTQKKGGFLAGTANYLDERVGVAGILKEFGRKIFPDHWSFMLGEVALYLLLPACDDPGHLRRCLRPTKGC